MEEPQRPHLHLVNTETGEVVEDERDFLIDQLKRDLHGKQAQLGKLRAEIRDLRSLEPEAETIRDVLIYWRDRCAPKAVIAPGGKRWEKTRQRLTEKLEDRDPWTSAELKLAIDGALIDPWLSGKAPKSKGYLDPQTIFRDAEMVEKLCNLALGFEAESPVPIREVADLVQEWGTVNWRHLLRICECGHRRVEHSRADPNREGQEPCFFCECQDFDADPFEPFNLK